MKTTDRDREMALNFVTNGSRFRYVESRMIDVDQLAGLLRQARAEGCDRWCGGRSQMANNPTAACPTCGRPWDASAMNGEQLVAAMRAGNAEVYLAKRGGYYLSRGLGQVTRAAIDQALSAGLITEKYPGRGLEYWVCADAK